MKMYKGFDKNLRCRDFQYEIGKEYTEEKAVLCKNGFHACENPIDVFSYYPPADSRYCEVDLDDISEQTSEDSKRAGKKIRIGAEIGIKGIVEAFIRFTFDRIDWKSKKATNTGDRSAATNTGYRSAATNTGYRSAATNTGNWSAATNTGDQSAATNTGDQSAATNTGDRSAAEVSGVGSIAITTGYGGRVRGAIGCAIVAVERDENGELLTIQSAIVDGDKIKPDIWYTVQNGQFVEAE